MIIKLSYYIWCFLKQVLKKLWMVKLIGPICRLKMMTYWKNISICGIKLSSNFFTNQDFFVIKEVLHANIFPLLRKFSLSKGFSYIKEVLHEVSPSLRTISTNKDFYFIRNFSANKDFLTNNIYSTSKDFLWSWQFFWSKVFFPKKRFSISTILQILSENILTKLVVIKGHSCLTQTLSF